jgi:hypothetical protein
VRAPNIRAVITPNIATTTRDPPGTYPLMLDGQKNAGRTNHARNEIGPCHGDMSAVGDGASARSNAVSQIAPSVR